MIRAAAKNHADVTVVVDPADYETLLNQLRCGSAAFPPLALRRQLT